ncbi:MAG: Glycosyl transferase family 2 [Candidatus Levybacteria bacterium GW2011_GWC2_40_7]|nr:MAG: Glycosyl transferase family 2 [Candidatus Levybacteria bacterium GW2011_GWC2_40_7]
MKKVFVITLNYKGDKNTKELLESFLKVDKSSFLLTFLIVDNYPKKPIEIDTDKYKGLNLKVIYNRENLGFSGGNNKGIKYALEKGADYVLLINNDTTVDANFLKELFEISEERENVGAVAPKIYFERGYEFHKDRYNAPERGRVIWYAGGEIDWHNVIAKHRGVDEVDNGQYDEVTETDFATGTCMFLSRNALEKVGLFDEKYFMYFEDTDLSMRLKRVGFRVFYVPRAVLWHKVAQSSGIGSDLNDYFITRNRLLFGMRYAKLRTRFALYRESLRFLLSGRVWQRKGVLDFYLGRLGKGSWH